MTEDYEPAAADVESLYSSLERMRRLADTISNSDRIL